VLHVGSRIHEDIDDSTVVMPSKSLLPDTLKHDPGQAQAPGPCAPALAHAEAEAA